MKHLLIFLVLTCSGLAFAQKEVRQTERAQPMPLAVGGLVAKQPKLRSTVPGWALTGTRPDAYEIRCDEVFTECGVPILRTRAYRSEPFGFGSLTHSESAAPWRGLRVELKAELRAGEIDGWAGLWMRVDGKDGQVLAFDNMQNRALRGTSSFEWYSVVLDVPAEAESISFGVMLHGPGAVFVSEIVFGEVTARSTPVTDLVGPLRAQALTDAK